MKFKFEVIPATELESGDIFYCTPDPEINEFGIDYGLTGTDQIFIVDDFYEEDDEGNYAVLVNGGWNIWFRPEEKVVRLAHYRELIRVIDMVKEGNPDMELGPNDIITKIDQIKEENPSFNIDLLSQFDWDRNIFDDDDMKHDDGENDELPF